MRMLLSVLALIVLDDMCHSVFGEKFLSLEYVHSEVVERMYANFGFVNSGFQGGVLPIEFLKSLVTPQKFFHNVLIELEH